MKKCLITGATGYLGRHVISSLLGDGYEVLAVGRSAAPQFLEQNGLTYFELDLQDTDAVSEFLSTHKPSYLVHLAWEATPGKFWHSPDNFNWVSASSHLLKNFVEAGGERAMLAGSCAEYKWGNEPLHETRTPRHPTTYYSVSKCAFHDMAQVIAKDISVVWGRIFFPYGPDEAAAKLVSHIYSTIKNDELPTFQTPDRAIDLVHVADVAAAFNRVLASDLEGAVNIGSGVAMLPDEIALICASLLGKQDLITALQKRASETTASVSVMGDTHRLKSVLKDTDIRSFEQGLKSYLESR
ncbi:NAD-dependent epimerase/dehydratase family protein [Sneathiella aquimaris]|uniref:NAD-dependent epimerase/dehydratase family protein n=1 Tax=Sneathiella aquimaris TaxID=2599305 RepID=UPI00146A3B1A|nr:NAD(P)-dependent oxidoreductase [Sneathiella aquimaris]